MKIKSIFTSDPILKITTMFSRLVKYVITQVHSRRKEEVMATGGEGGKRSRTLLDLNFVKKFDQEYDETDRLG